MIKHTTSLFLIASAVIGTSQAIAATGDPLEQARQMIAPAATYSTAARELTFDRQTPAYVDNHTVARNMIQSVSATKGAPSPTSELQAGLGQVDPHHQARAMILCKT
jgi:hypothetical protein